MAAKAREEMEFGFWILNCLHCEVHRRRKRAIRVEFEENYRLAELGNSLPISTSNSINAMTKN
jgi:hypothetical protein